MSSELISSRAALALPKTSGAARSDDAVGAADVRWIGGGDGRPPMSRAVGAWAERVAMKEGPAIHMRPELVLGKGPFVYGVWKTASDGEARLAELAVLAARTFRCATLPGFSFGSKLRALKLVGNELLTDGGGESLGQFLDATIQLLRDDVADCVHFEEVEVHSPLWEALAKLKSADAKVFYPAKPQPHWWIDFPNPAADYWKRFSGKDRREWNRRRKRLTHEVVRVTRAEQVADFVRGASEAARASWQGKRLGTSMENTADVIQWLQSLASLGALRSYLLKHEGRTIAYSFNLLWQGCVVTEEMGYDLEFAQFGPGRMLLYRVLEDLVEHDSPRLLSFGFGDAEYKKFLGTRTTMTGPVVLARRSVRPLMALHINQLRNSISEVAYRVLNHTPLMSRLRRKYRR